MINSSGYFRKMVASNFDSVEDDDRLTRGTRLIFIVFKDFFSNVAKSLINKLPNSQVSIILLHNI